LHGELEPFKGIPRRRESVERGRHLEQWQPTSIEQNLVE
jgi:hypothetical protein